MSALAREFRENQMDMGVAPPEVNAYGATPILNQPGVMNSASDNVASGISVQGVGVNLSAPPPPMPSQDEKAELASRAQISSSSLNEGVQGLKGQRAGDVGFLCNSVANVGRELFSAFSSKPEEDMSLQQQISVQQPRPMTFGL